MLGIEQEAELLWDENGWHEESDRLSATLPCGAKVLRRRARFFPAPAGGQVRGGEAQHEYLRNLDREGDECDSPLGPGVVRERLQRGEGARLRRIDHGHARSIPSSREHPRAITGKGSEHVPFLDDAKRLHQV